MSSIVRKCSAIILLFMILSSEILLQAAEDQNINIENCIYEVLARSNMRAEPSINGAWLMTIPQGAIVICREIGTGEFYEITYENVTGYIYEGCVRQVTDPQIISEVVAQYATTEQPQETTGYAANIIGSVAGLGGTSQTVEEIPQSIQVEVLVASNFRGTPSVDGKKLGSIPVGAMVSYLDEGDNGYTHISYQGQSGYIYTRFLELDGIVTSTDSGITQTIETPETQMANASSSNAGLAFQRGILGGYDVSEQISVEVEDVAASNMVEVQTMVSSASQAEVAAAGITSDSISYQISNRANMRSTPSRNGSWITTLPVGADIVKLGETTDGYTMVQYDGMVGYVLENCITDKVDISRLGSEPVLFTITAYCSCRICCGSYSPEVTGRESHTATGTVPQQGRTIAVDPRVIPYGTSVHIDGLGDFIAEDCGGNIRQNHIDVYFASHEEAVAFGSKRLYVTINH
ncbi:MAG: SH3 domain-containing protein [Lachnospiraceae bacterium]